MRQKILSALITSAVLTFCLTGCQGDVGTIQPETPAAETSAAETEARYRKELNEAGELCLIDTQTKETIPPFPEGWSGERISELVTIDGYQLTLPCKVSDILALSNDFRQSGTYDCGDGSTYFEISYKDNTEAAGFFSNETEMITFMNVFCDDYTKFEGVDSNSPDDVFSLFNNFRKSEDGSIIAKYFEQDIRYVVTYQGTNKSNCILSLSWTEI